MQENNKLRNEIEEVSLKEYLPGYSPTIPKLRKSSLEEEVDDLQIDKVSDEVVDPVYRMRKVRILSSPMVDFV